MLDPKPVQAYILCTTWHFQDRSIALSQSHDMAQILLSKGKEFPIAPDSANVQWIRRDPAPSESRLELIYIDRLKVVGDIQ